MAEMFQLGGQWYTEEQLKHLSGAVNVAPPAPVYASDEISALISSGRAKTVAEAKAILEQQGTQPQGFVSGMGGQTTTIYDVIAPTAPQVAQEQTARIITPSAPEQVLQKSQDWTKNPPTATEQATVLERSGYRWNQFTRAWEFQPAPFSGGTRREVTMQEAISIGQQLSRTETPPIASMTAREFEGGAVSFNLETISPSFVAERQLATLRKENPLAYAGLYAGSALSYGAPVGAGIAARDVYSILAGESPAEEIRRHAERQTEIQKDWNVTLRGIGITGLTLGVPFALGAVGGAAATAGGTAVTAFNVGSFGLGVAGAVGTGAYVIPPLLSRDWKESVGRLAEVGTGAGLGAIGYKAGFETAFNFPGKGFGLEMGETLKQLKYEDVESSSKSILDVKTGKIKFLSKSGGFASLGETEIKVLPEDIAVGFTKENLVKGGFGRGTVKSLFAKGMEESKGVLEADVWQLGDIRISSPALGQYGALVKPSYEYTPIMGMETSKLVGSPSILKEWSTPKGDWIATLSTAESKGLAIAPQGFSAFKGLGKDIMMAPAMGSGGGGKAFGLSFPKMDLGASFGGGESVVFKGMDFATGSLTAGLTGTLAGRMAVVQQYAPKQVQDIYTKVFAAPAVKPTVFTAQKQRTEVMNLRETARMTSNALTGAFKTRTEVAQGANRVMDVFQSTGLSSAMAQRQKQSTSQALQLRTMQATATATRLAAPTITMPKIPAFNYVSPFKMNVLGWGKTGKTKAPAAPRPKQMFQYTPSVVGMTFYKPISKAFKPGSIESLGPRPMLKRKDNRFMEFQVPFVNRSIKLKKPKTLRLFENLGKLF